MVKQPLMGKKISIGFLLTFISLDAIFLFSKRWQSYLYVGYFFLGLYLGNSRSTEEMSMTAFTMAFYCIYWTFLNPIFKPECGGILGSSSAKINLWICLVRWKGLWRSCWEWGEFRLLITFDISRFFNIEIGLMNHFSYLLIWIFILI